MLLKLIKKHISFELLREDLRKIGINFITAGIVGLFIAHATYPSFRMWVGAGWVIIVGIIALFFGLYKKENYG